MTQFLRKLLGINTRKASRTCSNRVRLSVEHLEDRVLQATGLASDVVWRLVSTTVHTDLNGRIDHATGYSQMNISKGHLDMTEVSKGRTFSAGVDFLGTIPQEIKGGQTFTITAKVYAGGAFDIGPASTYRSQITGKVQNVSNWSNLTVSSNPSYPQGVNAARLMETVTYKIQAPSMGTSFTLFQTAMGFHKYQAPAVTSYAWHAVKAETPPPKLPEGVQATFSGGVLTIQGTEKADTIIIDQNSGRIAVRGVQILAGSKLESSVQASSVTQISIYAKGGDDRVYLNGGSQSVAASTMIDGGAGNDLLVGAQSGKNLIYAGADNDTVWGGLSNDTLYGDGGNDSLVGQDGLDKLFGGWDNDTLDGGNNDDTLHGEHGDDKLFGRDGTDQLFGGYGSDWLEAGSGSELASFGDAYAGDKDWNAHVTAVAGATYGDIHQGQIGNCWFLASLSSVALRGVDLASRIKYVGNFNYEVSLFTQDGRPTTVRITFDGSGNANDPISGTRGESWTIIFRRAFLKLYGQTDNGGVASYALTALTGRASPYYWMNTNSNEHFNLIERMIRQGRNVVAGTDANWTDVALVAGHAYTVVSVVRDSLGRPASVIIRNPHGMNSRGSAMLSVPWHIFQRDMTGFWVN